MPEGLTKLFLSPLRFVALDDGTALLDLKLAEAERVTEKAQARRGNIIGRVDGSRVSLRISGKAHRFFTNKHTTSITWYADEDDLPALKWALVEAKQAAEFFA